MINYDQFNLIHTFNFQQFMAFQASFWPPAELGALKLTFKNPLPRICKESKSRCSPFFLSYFLQATEAVLVRHPMAHIKGVVTDIQRPKEGPRLPHPSLRILSDLGQAAGRQPLQLHVAAAHLGHTGEAVEETLQVIIHRNLGQI